MAEGRGQGTRDVKVLGWHQDGYIQEMDRKKPQIERGPVFPQADPGGPGCRIVVLQKYH